MVRKTGLLEGFRGALELPASELRVIYRELNERGLITKTGARGRAAPNLTALDGAKYLIACIIPPGRDLKHEPIVRDFGSLECSTTRESGRSGADPLYDGVVKLGDRHRFVDGLARFLELFSASEWKGEIDRVGGVRASLEIQISRLRVILELPGGVVVYSTKSAWLDHFDEPIARILAGSATDTDMAALSAEIDREMRNDGPIERVVRLREEVLHKIAALFHEDYRKRGAATDCRSPERPELSNHA